MERIAVTEHLNVFDSGLIQAFDGDESTEGNRDIYRRMYVGFEREMVNREDNFRSPAVTALVTVALLDDGTYWHFMEWLETSRRYTDFEYDDDDDDDDDDLAQTFRDELMAEVEKRHPEISCQPERCKAGDGSVYYLDTLVGEDSWEEN